MQRLSLKGGYCATYPESHCVFEKSSCDDISSWYSSGAMQGAPYSAHGGYCLLAKTVREMPLGRCDGVKYGQCAPNKESCEAGAAFEEAFDCITEEITFGRCGGRCSWSPLDCGLESWTFPAEGCTCDKVRVGGCEMNGSVSCAVSKDGCDAESTYLNPLEVASQTGTECYICMEVSEPVEIVSVPESAMKDSTLIDESSSPPSYLSLANDSLGISFVIGITLGGVLVVALLTYVLVFLRRRKQTAAAKMERGESTCTDVPPPSLELTTDNDDMVSNLDIEEFTDNDVEEFQ